MHSHKHIKYEIEFVNPKFAQLYGRVSGETTARNAPLREPYIEVRSALAGWLRDYKNDRGLSPAGAVPKFRFLLLVVDGKQLVGLGSRVVWCLHCEQVGPVRLDIDGDEECSNCGAGLGDLWGWAGEFVPGQVYEMYSPVFMAAMASK